MRRLVNHELFELVKQVKHVFGTTKTNVNPEASFHIYPSMEGFTYVVYQMVPTAHAIGNTPLRGTH